MEPEKKPENLAPPQAPQEDPTPGGEDSTPSPEKKPYKPYSRKARLWAWVGVAFMVFLTIMYAYSFASGSILMY